jgi:RND family efflux transporter MFP subunit
LPRTLGKSDPVCRAVYGSLTVAVLVTVLATLLATVLVGHTGASLAQTAPPPAPTAIKPVPEQTDGWFKRQWRALSGALSGGDERGGQHAVGAEGGTGGSGKAGIAAGGSSGPAPGAPPPPAVTTSLAVTRDLIEWDDYTGRFDAVDTVELRSRVSGFLLAVHFKDGQRVKKGDLLATIDARPFERVLDQVNAELVQAQTKVESTSKDVERGRMLADRKIIAEKVFDDRSNLKREAEAAVKVFDAKVKSAELDVSFTRITAPMDGVIGRNLVSAGNYVSASTTLVANIVAQDPMHIYFDVSENNTIKYKRLLAGPLASGQLAANGGLKTGATEQAGQVEIALSDEAGFPHKGRIDFADNRMDPATGTLRMRALVDNKAGLFAAGMFARVRIPASTRALTLSLPDDAIGTDQAAKFVYVIADDGSSARKVVTLGPVVDGLRIIRSGITATDWIVTRGIQRVRPGQKVNPKREPIQVTASVPAPATPR